jgi:ABC-type bacteriocin/lantibiotic exporter with double-glycine peptidase domain
VPNTLLPVPHQRQQQEADCLAACAAMVLAYLNVQIKYQQLLRLLKVKPYGTPGQNLKYLSSLGLQIAYREGSLEQIKNYLQNDVPCITLVRTADLSYWDYGTDHAVVVVGFDEQTIYVNDPAFDNRPIPVPVVEFELAWMAFDYRYGVITHQVES